MRARAVHSTHMCGTGYTHDQYHCPGVFRGSRVDIPDFELESDGDAGTLTPAQVDTLGYVLMMMVVRCMENLEGKSCTCGRYISADDATCLLFRGVPGTFAPSMVPRS